ncbi:hypothetical protein [Clostridium butyricum]
MLIAEESGKMPLIRRTENGETIVIILTIMLKIAAKDCYMRTDYFHKQKIKE